MTDEIKVAIAVALAAVTKWLMTERVPPDEETDAQRRVRIRRSIGGIMAGIILGYYGHATVIRNVGSLSPDDSTIVAILLAFMGEHIFRSLLERGPAIFQRFFNGKDGQ